MRCQTPCIFHTVSDTEDSMGIKERQVRDREAVQRAILDAARELCVTEGFQQVSIRKIAERIEYSPAAIYGYFPSKDDIFFALAEEGFRLLGDPAAVRHDPALRDAPPIERVRAVFRRLYEFSRDQPQYFALMFVDRSVPRISREYERFAFAREMKQHIVEDLQASDVLNVTLAGLRAGVPLQSANETACPLDRVDPVADAQAS